MGLAQDGEVVVHLDAAARADLLPTGQADLGVEACNLHTWVQPLGFSTNIIDANGLRCSIPGLAPFHNRVLRLDPCLSP